jgi:hypothetical protein
MQRLEVSGAVRHLYIYISLGGTGLTPIPLLFLFNRKEFIFFKYVYFLLSIFISPKNKCRRARPTYLQSFFPFQLLCD